MAARDIPRTTLGLIWMTLLLAWCVGILGRGFWTPDEPREADLAWRMSWQADKAIPLLAGEPFCEKPPLTYWAAGAAMAVGGDASWVARLPNLLYALVTALAVGWIGRRCGGPVASVASAAAIATFLLSYQVAIWLATDAPLLAAVAVALAGLYGGFYGSTRRARVIGYTGMHVALAVGFMAKSAAAWMVPALTLATLMIWERRWRELLRWELYAGLCLQAALILSWVWVVYLGPDGAAHLKVFFWNNLVGRFAQIDAPVELQYAAGHHNTPGKYWLELPVYLWPWTLLVLAAIRLAWRRRHAGEAWHRGIRFAAASFLPAAAVLSVAATARNIYLAPALPGVALLLGAWTGALDRDHDAWDGRALRGTAVLLLLAALVFAAAVALVGRDSWDTLHVRTAYLGISLVGVAGAVAGSGVAWRAVGRGQPLRSASALLFAYGALLVGPASQLYGRVDAWQDLGSIGRAMAVDAGGRPLLLFAPDETTRAFVDMYASRSVGLIPGPVTAASIARLQKALAIAPQPLVLAQLPGRNASRTLRELRGYLRFDDHSSSAAAAEQAPPAWIAAAGLHVAHDYAVPNGRRYALLESGSAMANR